MVGISGIYVLMYYVCLSNDDDDDKADEKNRSMLGHIT